MGLEPQIDEDEVAQKERETWFFVQEAHSSVESDQHPTKNWSSGAK
jgi:hypothetical protein